MIYGGSKDYIYMKIWKKNQQNVDNPAYDNMKEESHVIMILT